MEEIEMKTKCLFLFIVLFSITALMLVGCARSMSDSEYEKISEEFTDSFVHTLLNEEHLHEELDIEEMAYEKLDEVSRKSGYSARLYMAKAEEMGEDWDNFWARIEIRLNEEFERIWSQMEEGETGDLETSYE